METDLKQLLADVEQILDGIDRQETEDPDGWWETSMGAEFGKERLRLIRDIFNKELQRLSWVASS